MLLCYIYNSDDSYLESESDSNSVTLKCAACTVENQSSDSTKQVQARIRTLKLDEINKKWKTLDRIVEVYLDLSGRDISSY